MFLNEIFQLGDLFKLYHFDNIIFDKWRRPSFKNIAETPSGGIFVWFGEGLSTQRYRVIRRNSI